MNNNTLISVVIPCYNHAKFLKDSYSSIANQTWKNTEVIIVDDGSLDDTSKIALNLFSRYNKLSSRLIRQTNRGLAEARNAGIRAARGQWILTLDADDMFRPDFLSLAMKEAQKNPEINHISCGVQKFGHEAGIWIPRSFSPERLMEENTFPCASLFKKELWEKAGGYDPSHPWGVEDWNFWLRCMKAGIIPIQLPYLGMLYRTHKSGSMHSKMMNHWIETKALHYTMIHDIYSKYQILDSHDIILNLSPESEYRITQKIEQWPNLPLPLFWMGLIHEGRKNIGTAMEYYLRSISVSEANEWQPHFRVFIINNRIGRKNAAEKAMQECLRRKPDLEEIIRNIYTRQ